ncbi:MAG: ABC transporter substrate-binding protein [Actinomycetaceae bacterium]|nr:ABC transporter substrate-binding protein [Actinomycetaceae bacterium]
MKKSLFALTAVCALALGGCSSTSDDADTKDATPITVGLTYIPDIQFAPMYVAVEKGYFTDEGLDVTLRHHGAQEALLGALESGDEDVVFAGGDEMMQGRSTGIDVVNWATMYQQYPVTLIVPEDSDIQSPADIKGKKIGLPGPYGENYFAMLAMLKKQGLSEEEAGIQYIGYTQAAALEAGEVDGIIGFANSDTVSIETSGIPVRTIDMVDGGLPLVGVGLGSLSENLEKNKEAYQAMLRALEKAVAFAQENPEETLDITEKYVPALADKDARATAAKTLEKTLALYTGAEVFGSQNAETWEAMSAFEAENGIVETQVPAAEAYVDLTK